MYLHALHLLLSAVGDISCTERREVSLLAPLSVISQCRLARRSGCHLPYLQRIAFNALRLALRKVLYEGARRERGACRSVSRGSFGDRRASVLVEAIGSGTALTRRRVLEFERVYPKRAA